MSRTRNTIKNTASGFLIKILTLVLHFASRTIFVLYLGNEFLSINGLLSSVFSFLNITELGIGAALVFAMYNPIAKDDKEKVKQYVAYYKKIYSYLGLAVIGIGIVLLPFVNWLVPSDSTTVNVYLAYALFVANSACSYFFYVARGGFLSAMQQEYKLTLSNCIAQISTVTLQIIVLVLWDNFYLYLAVPIVVLVTQRTANGMMIGKWHPYIKEKPVGKLSKEEIKPIFKNTYGLAIAKISAIMNNAVDNIVITAVIGLSTVGPYSNYVLIMNMISGFASIGFMAVRPSVGNLHASSTVKHKLEIFHDLRLLSFWVYGICGVCYVCLVQQFIPIWIGDSYLMPLSLVIMVALNFVVIGLNSAVSIFREGCGLYYHGRYRPIFTALLNIALSILFGKLCGSTGIIAATTLSILLTTIWYDAYIVYRYVFNARPIRYLLKYSFDILLIITIGLISYLLCSLIYNDNIIGLILRLFICLFTFNALFWLTFSKNASYKKFSHLIFSFINRKS